MGLELWILQGVSHYRDHMGNILNEEAALTDVSSKRPVLGCLDSLKVRTVIPRPLTPFSAASFLRNRHRAGAEQVRSLLNRTYVFARVKNGNL